MWFQRLQGGNIKAQDELSNIALRPSQSGATLRLWATRRSPASLSRQIVQTSGGFYIKYVMAEHHLDAVVVGGGQAGLATGYYSRERERNFIILDVGYGVGDAWKRRWDFLRLFSPQQSTALYLECLSQLRMSIILPRMRWPITYRGILGNSICLCSCIDVPILSS
jgi:hypothetical protein